MKAEIADPVSFFKNDLDMESLVLETSFATPMSWMVIVFFGDLESRPRGVREFRRYTFEGVTELRGFERTRLWKKFAGHYVVGTAVPKQTVIEREWVRAVAGGTEFDLCITDLDCFSFECSKVYWEQLFARGQWDPEIEDWRYRLADGQLIDFDRPFGDFPEPPS